MALPSSGTISMSMIAAEFGGSAPHALSEYYRGGGLVPNTPANSAVPTSGTIKLTDFYGATNISPLSASASPAGLFGLRVGAGSLSKTTTITASGGVPPYSYSTTWSSGGYFLSVINGGSNTPGASGSASPTIDLNGTLRCRVTDSASNYVDVFIDVSFSWEA